MPSRSPDWSLPKLEWSELDESRKPPAARWALLCEDPVFTLIDTAYQVVVGHIATLNVSDVTSLLDETAERIGRPISLVVFAFPWGWMDELSAWTTDFGFPKPKRSRSDTIPDRYRRIRDAYLSRIDPVDT